MDSLEDSFVETEDMFIKRFGNGDIGGMCLVSDKDEFSEKEGIRFIGNDPNHQETDFPDNEYDKAMSNSVFRLFPVDTGCVGIFKCDTDDPAKVYVKGRPISYDKNPDKPVYNVVVVLLEKEFFITPEGFEVMPEGDSGFFWFRVRKLEREEYDEEL